MNALSGELIADGKCEWRGLVCCSGARVSNGTTRPKPGLERVCLCVHVLHMFMCMRAIIEFRTHSVSWFKCSTNCNVSVRMSHQPFMGFTSYVEADVSRKSCEPTFLERIVPLPGKRRTER